MRNYGSRPMRDALSFWGTGSLFRSAASLLLPKLSDFRPHPSPSWVFPMQGKSHDFVVKFHREPAESFSLCFRWGSQELITNSDMAGVGRATSEISGRAHISCSEWWLHFPNWIGIRKIAFASGKHSEASNQRKLFLFKSRDTLVRHCFLLILLLEVKFMPLNWMPGFNTHTD